jgi:sulfur carrier protein
LLELKSNLGAQNSGQQPTTRNPKIKRVDDRISHIKSSAITTSMITAKINGIREKVKAGTTISILINDLNIANRKIALEVNGEIIPRSQFDSRILEDGDQIEIVTAVGGG